MVASRVLSCATAVLAFVALIGSAYGDCVSQGLALKQGSCASIVNSVQQNAANIKNADCGRLRAAVQNALNQGVKPSAQCCTDIKAFISASCTCNSNVLNNVGLVGLTADTVTAAGYIAQLDIACGPVCNPCGNGPCGCGDQNPVSSASTSSGK